MFSHRLKNFFSTGHERTIRTKKNIFWSFILRTVNISTGIIIIPLVLTYLDSTKYGIWLTISSIIVWFNFFDAGLGHGLRNKLSEALAKKDLFLAKKYISTTYASVSILMFFFLFIFLLVNRFLNWSVILNSKIVAESELKLVVLITFTLFSLRLVMQLINSILYAKQEPAFKELIDTLGKLLNVLVVFILIKTTAAGSLIFIVLSYMLSPLIIIFLFSVIFYCKSLKEIRPSFKFIDFSYFKDLFGLGGKFFIIQTSIVVLYSTDNIIISQLFSPADVAPYQIANRYFSVILMGLSIISVPFWSAITDAYVKGEMNWIVKSIKSLVKIWIISLFGLGLMLILSKEMYYLWVGNKVVIPFVLSCTWFIFIALQSLNNIFMLVVNGTGKIKLQMYVTLLGALTNIPLSIFFAKNLNLGVVGVLIATIIYQAISLAITYKQYKKIIKGELIGIWGK